MPSTLPLNDLTGQRFGRLVVKTFKERNTRYEPVWSCLCDCGISKDVRHNCLTKGFTKSCGCYRKELSTELSTTHGLQDTDEWRTWSRIKNRCNNPKSQDYHNYGGRGITLDPDFATDFLAFYNEVGQKPSKLHSIDRKDNSKGYVKGNLKWSTKQEQARNRRTNITITMDGETKCLIEWCEIYRIKWKTVKYRLTAGWDAEKAIKTPSLRPRSDNNGPVL